jgi:hypothetical protein
MSADHRRKAQRLLEQLLPEAERASVNAGPLTGTTAVGSSATPWMRIDNIRGVHIYQGRLGGWFADLEMRTVPAGVPNVVGTPVKAPCSSRNEAIANAVSLLAFTIANARNPAPDRKSADAGFAFGGFGLTIPSILVDEITRTSAEVGITSDPDYVRGRLAEVHAKHRTFMENGGDLNDLPEKDRRELLVVCTMALCHGMPRWPELSEEAPEPAPAMN